MASASSWVRVDCVPLPIRRPPEVLLPGMTMRRLLPMLAICSEILSLAPVPTASMVMTAPTPMMIPSMVRAERILLTRRARSDIFNVEGMLIMAFSLWRSHWVLNRLSSFVADDAPVEEADDPPAEGGDVRFMGHEDDRDARIPG